MKFAKTLLIGVSSLALGTGAALAADTAKDDPGFNKLDKNNDGYLSRSEAAKNPYLAKHFKEADKDGDGKLSRTEYLTVMTKKDLKGVKDKVAGNKQKDGNAATGSSKPK
jgi:Ca2+-binding EF-hand superfamily protein